MFQWIEILAQDLVAKAVFALSIVVIPILEVSDSGEQFPHGFELGSEK
jgi:hypothetical protein